MDNYLSGFFGGTEGWLEEGDGSQFARDWDQVLTLPRRLTLRGRHEVDIQPAGDIASLRSAHRHIGRTVVAPNREVVLDEIEGDAIELSIEVDPKHSSAFEVDVLRSPGREEYTRICLYHRRGFKYREPLPDDVGANRVMSTALSTVARYESVITIDNSCSSTLPDALSRPPESAPVLIEPGKSVRLRIFVDRSVVEVFVNGRQCVAVRVYPGRPDSPRQQRHLPHLPRPGIGHPLPRLLANDQHLRMTRCPDARPTRIAPTVATATGEPAHRSPCNR